MRMTDSGAADPRDTKTRKEQEYKASKRLETFIKVAWT